MTAFRFVYMLCLLAGCFYILGMHAHNAELREANRRYEKLYQAYQRACK